MTKCRLCQHTNPPGVQRCEECGTWLSQDAEPATPGDRASANATKPDAVAPPAANEFESQVLVLLQSGQKIAAIKRYREEKCTGLKEAKEAVEALAERHGMPHGSGCASAVLVLLVIGVALVVVL